MSGGYFNHQQYRLENMASQIEELIESNDDETLNQWGEMRGRGYSASTMAEFETAVRLLRQALVYVNGIDYLVNSDVGEETFHKCLKGDLEKLKVREAAECAQEQHGER